MNKSLLLIISLVAFLNSCYFSGVNGNGNVIEENRSVKEFTSIDASGNMKILLLPSKEPYVKVYADDNLMELIVTKSNGRELSIYPSKQIGKFEKLLVEVGIDDLRSIDISGAVDVHNNGTIRTERLDVDCSGAAEIDLDVRTEELRVELSGAGDIDLSGKTKELDLDISGAAEVVTVDLQADDVELEISGAGYCKLYARKSLYVDASGAADVDYTGDPKKIKVNNSGASSVNPF